MKQTRLLMGMPITLEILDTSVKEKDLDTVYAFFITVDNTFSTYKADSEISLINTGMIKPSEYSKEMREIFDIAEQTKKKTQGFFEITLNGKIDPSGVVKGWAIEKAVEQLKEKGFDNFFVEAGGDIQTQGKNETGENWKVGIRNPFDRNENVKIVAGENIAVATSGTAIRGAHIYNPMNQKEKIKEIVSMTIIGSSILEADLYATAAFAMGKSGIQFIETVDGYEGYMIDKDGIAMYTNGFEKYVV